MRLALVTTLVMTSVIMSSCKDEPPPKPQVVRKKIVLPPGKLSRTQPDSPTETADKAAGSKGTLALRPRSDVAQPAPSPAPSAPKAKPAASPEKTAPKAAPAASAASDQAPTATPQAPEKGRPVIAMRPKSDIAQPSRPATAGGMDVKSDIAQAGKPPTDSKPLVDIQKPQASLDKPLTPSALSQEGLPAPYVAAGKIDPFEPLFKEEVAVAPKPKEPQRPRTPLEQMALNQLKLVAIVMSPSGNMAMVQEASGKGYTIKKGTYIGLNRGQVVEISKDKLIIEERVENLMGKETIRTKELVLPKPRGEL